MDTPDLPDVAEQRLSILQEIAAGRSVTVHGEKEYLNDLRHALADGGCSVYLADVVGEIVLVVEPTPGASGSDDVAVVDVG